MKRTLINPPEMAAPRGFNHGILVEGGRLLFLAGQDASDGTGAIVAEGDLAGQFRQVLKNLRRVVEQAGGRGTDIAKLNIFVRNRDEYLSRLSELGGIYRQELGTQYPAMALFEVTGFFNPAALIELEGMAVIPAVGSPSGD
jgi:enamine deaminase RidA (YjgF/YER057c/UK114 family)